MTPYVKVPLWVYHAMETGRITHEQLDVLNFAYYKANWATLVVSSYSAENLCRFLRLDATDANLKRYRRAVLDLVVHGIIRYDYRRGDKRPFHLFLPPAETENIESLYVHPIVRDSVRDSVGVVVPENVDSNPADSMPYHANDSGCVRDSVGVVVRENSDLMSAKDQGNSKTTERDPLNPPTGDFSPAPLPPGGERSGAAGLLSQKRTGQGTDKKMPLNVKQCDALDDASTLYIAFVVKFCSFSPDRDHVKALLRKFKPTEILFAQLSRFPSTYDFRKTDMAHFFAKAACDAINAGRLQGTSASLPEYFDLPDARRDWQAHSNQWTQVVDTWNDVSINGQHDDGFVIEPPLPPKPHKPTIKPSAPKADVDRCKGCGIPVPARHLYCDGIGCKNPWCDRVAVFIKSLACNSLADMTAWLAANRNEKGIATLGDFYVGQAFRNLDAKPELQHAWREWDEASRSAAVGEKL